MKPVILYLTFTLTFIACSGSSSDQPGTNEIDKKETINLTNLKIADDKHILVSVKNNTENDYYVDCFDHREKVPALKGIKKEHISGTNEWTYWYFRGGEDTLITLKKGTETKFRIYSTTKLSDTIHFEAYFNPIDSLLKKEKLIMHFIIEKGQIRSFNDVSYIDRDSITKLSDQFHKKHPLSKELLDKIKTDSTLIANEVLARKSGSKISSPAK